MSLKGSTQFYDSGKDEASDETLESSLKGDLDGSTRRRIVSKSKHGEELERIRSDGARTVRHHVPDQIDDESRSHGPAGARQWLRRHINSYRDQSPEEWVATLLPCYRWLKSYKVKETLSNDVIAGLTVGMMVVPQSMSYAKLAGLPVEYGLYSALMPVYFYGLFGTSRQLAVGPVAIVSLLLSTGLSDVLSKEGVSEDDPNYQDIYNALAIQTSLFVGITYIGMGLLRLGFVTVFLSHAVISGFTTGASIIIGLSQVKYIVGYNVERSDLIYEELKFIFQDIDQFSWKTFVLGTTCIMVLLGMKHVGKTYKRWAWIRPLGPLTVAVVTIILVVAFNLQDKGIPIVAYIPKGLPNFTPGKWFPLSAGGSKFTTTILSVVIVGFMESIAIAKALAAKHKYEIDSSQELFGLGMANFAGAMFQSYPVTGSFSRSAVNHDSGAKTGLAGIITATVVGFVLLVLTPVFEKIPTAVLGAIVIAGVIGLFDYPEAIYLWKVHRFDLAVWVISFLGTMFLGVEIGLGISVGVSLLIVIWESAYPHVKVLGRLPGTTVYRCIKQYPEAELYDGIISVRIDAPLYFANAQNVRDKIRKYRLRAEDDLAKRGGTLKYLILDLSPVTHMDTTALHILEDMDENFKSRNQQLCFSNPSTAVMGFINTSGLAEKIGREHFFTCLHDAVSWCLQEMDCEAVSSNGGEKALLEEGAPVDEEEGA
jgi:sulfate transporter 4